MTVHAPPRIPPNNRRYPSQYECEEDPGAPGLDRCIGSLMTGIFLGLIFATVFWKVHG